MEVQPRQVIYYQAENGAIPFKDWLESLDRRPRARIDARLTRIRKTGNYGDCDPVGDGVYELKDHYGAGYRVYFGEIGNELVLLLWGGTKNNKKDQSRDIRKAQEYWQDHKARQGSK